VETALTSCLSSIGVLITGRQLTTTPSFFYSRRERDFVARRLTTTPESLTCETPTRNQPARRRSRLNINTFFRELILAATMSERGRRGQTAGTGKVPAGGDGKKFGASLQKIVGEIDKLLKDTDGLDDYESLLTTRNNLRQELEEKNREIEMLKKEATDLGKQKDEETARLEQEANERKRSLDLMMEDFGTRYANWREDMSRHAADSTELARLSSELKVAREAAKKADLENHELRQKLDTHVKQFQDCQSSMTTLTQKYEKRSSKLKDTLAELEKCREILTGLKEDLGILPFNKPQA